MKNVQPAGAVILTKPITVPRMVMQRRRHFWVNPHLMPATCSNVVSGKAAWASCFRRATFSKPVTR